jgi:metallo-beta-lactamase family protein
LSALSFHGGAGTVTGSRHLLETKGARLLVDCGLFQGEKELRQRNWEPPGFEPSSISAVALTHAHIDHSGYLPRLVREGFRGPIHATPATADLADLLLRDAAQIQEEDAAYANLKGFSKHHPALPLFTLRDAERAIGQIEVVDFDAWVEVKQPIRLRFRNAGHILGSGYVELELADREPPLHMLFSGDIGRYAAPLVRDPSPPPACDVLVMESTYGDRDHPTEPVQEQLRELLAKVVERKSTLLVPAFAVGRSQQLLYLLKQVMHANPRLAVPIHLDSPMAVDTTEIYCRYPEEAGLEQIEMRPGSDLIYGRDVFLHRSAEESKRLNDLGGPRVIVSSSGMMTGGRVLHHLRRLLPVKENLVVLAGYQAPGTRGRALKDGAETLRIHGQDVPVACELAEVTGLSAHADRGQLLRWARALSPAPRVTYVTHGDPEAAAALAELLRQELGFRCEVPALGASYEL